MLDWIFELADTSPIAHSLGLVAFVCAVGMAVGSIKVKGIGLGSAGVLFMGFLAAQFSKPIEPHTLAFIRELGLLLFVFSIGLQLGPGFFSSLKADGLRLNILAAALVLLGGILAPVVAWLGGIDLAAVSGLFAGASTNSPALGAAQPTLAAASGITPERLALPALACAVSYPAAIAALLATIVGLKVIFRIDPVKEAEEHAASQRRQVEPVERRTLAVQKPELIDRTLQKVYQQVGPGVMVSRIRSAGETEVHTALYGTTLRISNVILAVGTARRLDDFARLGGDRSDEDLLMASGPVSYRRVVVTESQVLGKTTDELGLDSMFGVEVTRITRGEIEMTAVPSLRLQFGDILQIVGAEEQLGKAADYLGNSLKKLNETHFVPLFAGICVGILVGSVPLLVPGLSQPLKLGLAGGPLVVALILGRIGHLGRLVWHMPPSANHAFREFGVALFFAALGLAAGDQFFIVVMSPRGLQWLAAGLAITIVPLMAIARWSRLVAKMDFVTLGGLLSGAMTNPPALNFVNNLCRSESPTLAYATVYPLTTLLRILVAQILALAFGG